MGGFYSQKSKLESLKYLLIRQLPKSIYNERRQAIVVNPVSFHAIHELKYFDSHTVHARTHTYTPTQRMKCPFTNKDPTWSGDTFLVISHCLIKATWEYSFLQFDTYEKFYF